MSEWRKVIPEGRDRLQSRVLVWVVGMLLVAPLPAIIPVGMRSSQSSVIGLKALVISLTFGVMVWALRAANRLAAFFGSVICFWVIVGTGFINYSMFHSGLAPLAMLFILTFAATKAGRRRKVQLGVAEEKRGRNAAQIIANLGATGLSISALYLLNFISEHSNLLNFIETDQGYVIRYGVALGVLATLCEATADTVSSEIGQAFGGQPVMLTTFRRVAPGTDGAVTILGTVAGILGAAVVATVGMWGMRMNFRSAAIGFAGGVAGLFFDSVLGATVERKGWLGNDLVNFSSTVFAVGVALGLAVAFLRQ